jgi:hypothetical protein
MMQSYDFLSFCRPKCHGNPCPVMALLFIDIRYGKQSLRSVMMMKQMDYLYYPLTSLSDSFLSFFNVFS